MSDPSKQQPETGRPSSSTVEVRREAQQQDDATGDAFDVVGHEVAIVLRAAHEAADEILRQARAEADRTLAVGEADARRIREAAAQGARNDLQRTATEDETTARRVITQLQSQVRQRFAELSPTAIAQIKGAVTAIEEENRQLRTLLSASPDGTTNSATDILHGPDPA